MSQQTNVEALEIIASLCADNVLSSKEEAILRKALAKSRSDVKQEPVAIVADLYPYRRRSCGLSENTNLYTHPQPKRRPSDYEWVGLTDSDIEDVWGEDVSLMYSGHYDAIRDIEAKLKEKNT